MPGVRPLTEADARGAVERGKEIEQFLGGRLEGDRFASCNLRAVLLGRYPLNGITLYCRDVEMKGGLVHLDGGGVRIALHPAAGDELPPRGSYLVFLIGDGIDGLCRALEARGVAFSASPEDTPVGRLAFFHDPDGHLVHLWRPDGDRYASVVEHHERLLSRDERPS